MIPAASYCLKMERFLTSVTCQKAEIHLCDVIHDIITVTLAASKLQYNTVLMQ